jgi:membrane-bound lytic murein transglycosylase D
LPIRVEVTFRALAIAFALIGLACPAAALNPFLGGSDRDTLPLPASLAPNVAFWARIYSEVDTQGGLIHDSVHLDVVYEEIRLPKGVSSRSRERHVEKIKKGYRAILRELGAGKRTGLSREQKRVLALWPDGVSNSTLRGAARNVRFQLGQADKFRAGLVRSGAWRDYIEETLSERGLPPEIACLPHVESSYNPRAYSRVGAAGMWQFTRSTGRRYLRVDHVVDERLDPYKSTVAAARLLTENYRSVGTWPLAITSYNHGAAGMRRAVRKLGTDDIGVIVRKYKSRTFGFASRNFYASFLAAVEVDRNAKRLFGSLKKDRPVTYDRVQLDAFYPATSLARAFGLDQETLRNYNPALRPAVWNGSKYMPRDFEVLLPVGTVTKQHRDRYYKVRRGDTLSIIARRYGVRMSELVALNNLRSRHSIKAGQVLILPDHAGGRTTVVRVEPRPADGIYRVRRGDTLSIIARRFDTSERELTQLNNLRNPNRLAVGQRLVLPGAPVVVASATPPPAPEPPPASPEAEVAVEVAVVEVPARTDAPAPNGDGAKATPVVIASIDSLETPAVMPLAPPPAQDPAAASDVGPAMLPIVQAAVVAREAAGVPDPSNYAVGSGDRIVVHAEETLGHYADWLELPTNRLRRLNRMGASTPLAIGRRVRLDFSRVTPETFEQRRLEYHQELQAEFFASFLVAGTESYVLSEGDTLWYLARRKFELPLWLLHHYNPDLDLGSLTPGVTMTIPIVEPRDSASGSTAG